MLAATPKNKIPKIIDTVVASSPVSSNFVAGGLDLLLSIAFSSSLL